MIFSKIKSLAVKRLAVKPVTDYYYYYYISDEMKCKYSHKWRQILLWFFLFDFMRFLYLAFFSHSFLLWEHLCPNLWLFTTYVWCCMWFHFVMAKWTYIIFFYATMFYFVSWTIFGLIHSFIHSSIHISNMHTYGYQCQHLIIILQMRNDTFGWPFILIVVDGKYFGFFAFKSSRLMFDNMAYTVFRMEFVVWSMDHRHH